MTGALSPYRVLEHGDHVAGAVLGMLLADQGAEVIKIEGPQGDPLRGHPAFSVWNRGKKSVVLDPREERHDAVLAGLIRSSDVVVESWLSASDRLPSDRSAAGNLTQDKVYVALPGFRADHHEGEIDASEPVIGALTGIYTERDTSGPSFIALPYASIFGAMVAAPAVTAALFHLLRTKEGQRVTVPLYDAMFAAMGAALVTRPEVSSDGNAPSPAIRRFYRCGDDRWVNINATYERAFRPMLEALGHPEWHGPLTDRRLLDDEHQIRRWDEKVASAWTTKPAFEWEAIMEGAGVPCTVCRTLEEWMETTQAHESTAVVDIRDPVYGPMRQVGIQVRLSDSPGEIHDPAPTHGQHTESIIASLR